MYLFDNGVRIYAPAYIYMYICTPIIQLPILAEYCCSLPAPVFSGGGVAPIIVLVSPPYGGNLREAPDSCSN